MALVLEQRRKREIRHDLMSQLLRSIRVLRVNGSLELILGTMTTCHVRADQCISDRMGYSPLHVAAQKGNTELVDCFLGEPGVNVNVNNRLGRSPIHAAILNNHEDVVHLLLKHGGKVSGDTFRLMVTQTALKRGEIGGSGVGLVSDDLVWVVTREVALTGTIPTGDGASFTPIAGTDAGPLCEHEFSVTRTRVCGWREATAMQRRVVTEQSHTEDEYDPWVPWRGAPAPAPAPTDNIRKRKAATEEEE